MANEANMAATGTSVEKQVQTALVASTAAPVNRTYKSTLFIMLFQDKNNLLELYNAVSGKHYTDPGLLEINTLENAIYMTVKNDVSFLIDGRLSLYEHQSTYNPNLPLRFLIYISKLYSRMTRNENLYGTKMIRIPPPEFLIFYNGKEDLPDQTPLNLSDMYYKTDDSHAGLELTAVMLNISGKHRAEAKEMSIFEYDQEKHMRQEREEAWADGHSAGLKEGRAAGLEEARLSMIIQMLKNAMSEEDISRVAGVSQDEIKKAKEMDI